VTTSSHLSVRAGRPQGQLLAAGGKSEIPQSTASRAIAERERRVGGPLFVRSTRAGTLTDAGSDFLARIEAVLAELEDAERTGALAARTPP
jgi:DNA-binding transcriptional LysR family regulator